MYTLKKDTLLTCQTDHLFDIFTQKEHEDNYCFLESVRKYKHTLTEDLIKRLYIVTIIKFEKCPRNCLNLLNCMIQENLLSTEFVRKELENKEKYNLPHGIIHFLEEKNA